VISVNVNGVRAAARRGGLTWLREADPDVICLQEVRASDEQLEKELAEAGLGHLHVAHAPAAAAGRSGVAILSRTPLKDVRTGVGPAEFDDSGRWIEGKVTGFGSVGSLSVVSTYVHTGQAQTLRQDEKYRFLDATTARMGQLHARHKRTGAAIVCGDLNVARNELDIKNHKGNRGKAGFLEDERAILDSWCESGWFDLGREHAGEVDGPYTWWSWRGQAFDNDTGWRIDYALGTRRLAHALTRVDVGRARSYAQRWSDHAPVTATFA